MGWLDRLFGKKEENSPACSARENGGPSLQKVVATARPERREPAAIKKDSQTLAISTGKAGMAREMNSLPPEVANLKRWKESGQARAWVAAHQGQWNHGDWLALLDDLKRAGYWPMQPEAVGNVLEEMKRESLSRN